VLEREPVQQVPNQEVHVPLHSRPLNLGELARFFVILELDSAVAIEDFLQLSVALGGLPARRCVAIAPPTRPVKRITPSTEVRKSHRARQ
jgi:hypothetical protein